MQLLVKQRSSSSYPRQLHQLISRQVKKGVKLLLHTRSSRLAMVKETLVATVDQKLHQVVSYEPSATPQYVLARN